MSSGLFFLFDEIDSAKHQSGDGNKADPDRKMARVVGVGRTGSDSSVSGCDGAVGRSRRGTSAGGRGIGLELEVGVGAFDLSGLVESLAKEQIIGRVRGQVRLVQRDGERDFVVLELKVAELGSGVIDLVLLLFVGVDIDVFGHRLQKLDVSRFAVVEFRGGIFEVDGDVDVRSTVRVSGERDVRCRSGLLRFGRAGRRSGAARRAAGARRFIFAVFLSAGRTAKIGYILVKK